MCVRISVFLYPFCLAGDFGPVNASAWHSLGLDASMALGYILHALQYPGFRILEGFS